MVARLLRNNIADLVRFSSVCGSWRSVVVCNRRRLRSDIPWLLFPTSPPEEMRYCLVSLFDTRDYTLSLARRINCSHLLVGAYQSWLLIACRDGTLCLYNPFLCAQVSLPGARTWPRSVIKFVMSANPSEGVDWVLMAIVYENKLMFFTSWDQAWTSLSSEIPLVDLVYHHHGRFLALYASGKILGVYFEGHSHSTSEIGLVIEYDQINNIFRNAVSGIVTKIHLVSSSEQVLQLLQIGRIGDKETIAFVVFRLDWSSNSMIQMHHLDDIVLYVSENYSGSWKASEIPGFLENCIYFTESRGGNHAMFLEMSACCLQGMRIELLARCADIRYPGLPNNALWITPSLSLIQENSYHSSCKQRITRKPWSSINCDGLQINGSKFFFLCVKGTEEGANGPIVNSVDFRIDINMLSC